jgi:hypothetical protein
MWVSLFDIAFSYSSVKRVSHAVIVSGQPGGSISGSWTSVLGIRGVEMPYKDSERKKEWEQEHRSERLARRRELRQFEAARTAAQPGVLTGQDGSASILFPLVAGGPLAAYNPKLAVAAGTVTLLVAALYKKDWLWWIVGILILAFGPRY